MSLRDIVAASTSTLSSSHSVLQRGTNNEHEEGKEEEEFDGYYYEQASTARARLRHHYVNIELCPPDDGEDDDSDLKAGDSAKIKGLLAMPQFNGKQVQLVTYLSALDAWRVSFEHCSSESHKCINIPQEFLAACHDNHRELHVIHHQQSSASMRSQAQPLPQPHQTNAQKAWLKAQTCGYYLLLAFLVVSCTCLLLTPFWSFSSLIFGRSDGYLYYVCYTLFCGAMCCIIWNNKINAASLWQEMRHCSIECVVCWSFYMFCCLLLWAMASYFGGFFFIYLWYCSQEIHAAVKRVAIFDEFVQNAARGSVDVEKRVVCVYFYCLMNFQSNIHKIYKQHILRSYLLYQCDADFIDSATLCKSMMQRQWFANCNLMQNIPYIAGIGGYHFLIWFAVFYLHIRDWSFLITIFNDVLLMVCIAIGLGIHLGWYHRCRRQVTLNWLKYFNLESLSKQHTSVVNQEVNNLYIELHDRMQTIAILSHHEVLPPFLLQLILSFLFIQNVEYIPV